MRIAKRHAALLLAGLAILVPGAVLALRGGGPEPRYEVTFLPSLGGFRAAPHSINDRGQVVGTAETAARTHQIFLWDKQQGFRVLGSFSDAPYVGRLLLNDAGLVAGTVTTPAGHRRAFLWDLSAERQLLDTFGGNDSIAMDFNNAGQIVGSAETPEYRRHAFIWDAGGGMRDLGTLGGDHSVAMSVNDAGQVVGFSETAERLNHMFYWDSTTGMVDLGREGIGTGACQINNQGYMVRKFVATTHRTHIAVGTRAAGLRRIDFVGADTAEPCGLNDANRFLIRGRPARVRAFGRIFHQRQECYLWDPNSGLVPLQEYLPVKDIALLTVGDMNNHGWIVGQIQVKGVNQLRAVVLEPIR